MAKKKTSVVKERSEDLFQGKSAQAIELYDYFVKQYQKIASVTVHPAKTMVGIATPRKRICYVTQLGKDFIHVVFPFAQSYDNNLCFLKIAHVPEQKQFNHHFRMYAKEDLNAEVKGFMQLAYEQGV
jgi:hypothetical protein